MLIRCREDSTSKPGVYLDKTYTYDKAGNRLSTVQKEFDGMEYVQNYTYDILNQLVQNDYGMKTLKPQKGTYVYDLQGNRTRTTWESTVKSETSIEIAKDSNQIAKSSDSEYSWTDYLYDGNGNLTGKTLKDDKQVFAQTDYIWDVQNRLTEVKKDGKTVEKNSFDANGMRTEQTTTDKKNKSVTVKYFYDNSQRLIADRTDTVNATYLYLGSQKIAKVRSNNGQDTVFYSHTDSLGTPVTISLFPPNAKKPFLSHYYLGAFGEPIERDERVGFQQPVEFTGKGLDEECGLFYFNARFFDPMDGGRFLGHDLVGPKLENPLSLNPFLFCENNPTRYVDRDGRFAEEFLEIWDEYVTPALEERAANGSISFINAYTTAKTSGKSSLTSAIEGTGAFIFDKGVNGILGNPIVRESAVNAGVQTVNILMDPKLTYKDFSISEMLYNGVTNGTISVGLNALRLQELGGTSGLIARGTLEFGLGFSAAMVGRPFSSEGDLSYNLGDMRTDFGFGAAWNRFLGN